MTKKSPCKELKLTTDGLEKEALDHKRAKEELSIVSLKISGPFDSGSQDRAVQMSF
jgi:hypothetical protein